MRTPQRIPAGVFQQLLAEAIVHDAGVHPERARSFASYFISIEEFIETPFRKRRFLSASGKPCSILTATETKRAEVFRRRIAALKNPIEEMCRVAAQAHPANTGVDFLEILLARAMALTKAMIKMQKQRGELSLEDRVNAKLKELSMAFAELQFPRASLPEWVRKDFADHELFWLAAAMTAFFDKGV